MSYDLIKLLRFMHYLNEMWEVDTDSNNQVCKVTPFLVNTKRVRWNLIWTQYVSLEPWCPLTRQYGVIALKTFVYKIIFLSFG